MKIDWDKIHRKERTRQTPIDTFRPAARMEFANNDADFLMQLTRDGKTVGARWQRRNRKWICVSASPEVEWMKTTPRKELRPRLAAAGWRYQWIRITT